METRLSARTLVTRSLVVLFLLCGIGGHATAATQVGETQLARGLVSAAGPGANARLIGSGAAIFQGDVVTTGPRSSAILKLADGSRIMIRPQSSFTVEEFSTDEAKPLAVMRLFKGGLRAVTGFISKRNPNAMRLRTAVATIGIRGTELDVRLCGSDCADEAKARPAPSGRVAFAKGNVIATASSGRARALKTGYPVFNGERIATGADAYTVLVFRDSGRVTVLPNTEFVVERFEYMAEAPAEGRSFFRLVRGGLRAVTGAIGKARRSRYRMNTPVATIGIRGTAYDAVCQGTCINPGGAPDPGGDGLFVDVTDGFVDFDGANPTGAGDEVVMINAQGATPFAVAAMPFPITQPDPASVPLPPAPPSDAPGQGLFVSCYVGNCSVQTTENTVDLEAGEAGFVGEGPAEQLNEIPAFQAEDPIYQALEVGGSTDPLDVLLDGGGNACLGP